MKVRKSLLGVLIALALLIICVLAISYAQNRSADKAKPGSKTSDVLLTRIQAAPSNSLDAKVNMAIFKQGIQVKNLSSKNLTDCQFRVVARYSTKDFSIQPGETVFVGFDTMVNISPASKDDYTFNVDSASGAIIAELVCSVDGKDETTGGAFSKTVRPGSWSSQLPDAPQ